jgi:RPA family protein
MSSDDEAVSREVAWRVFAREYDDADFAFKEGEDERAPNYVATPTGAKINRLFVVGVLTEVERVGEGDLLRARVSDPMGAFVVYAGQYQPDAVSFLADAETPEFVAVVGKARTYEPDDSDDVYTSIRPEEMNVVDAETRDRWNVETARETLRRVEATREYLRDGATPETRPELHELGEVIDHYGTDEAYLNKLEREARDVLTEVAGVEATEMGAGGATTTETNGATEKTEAADVSTPDEAVEESTGADTTAETTEDAASGSVESDAETGAQTGDAAADEDDFSDIEQEDVGKKEVGDWEWDEGQREEVEEEFGAEFETGAEFADEETEGKEAGETVAGDAEKEEQTEAPDAEDAETTETEGKETAEETETADETAETADESAETVVMNIIEDESGDDGVERSEIVAEATERGLDEEVVEATLEDLLLEGMCYPTDGDRIKPI